MLLAICSPKSTLSSPELPAKVSAMQEKEHFSFPGIVLPFGWEGGKEENKKSELKRRREGLAEEGNANHGLCRAKEQWLMCLRGAGTGKHPGAPAPAPPEPAKSLPAFCCLWTETRVKLWKWEHQMEIKVQDTLRYFRGVLRHLICLSARRSSQGSKNDAQAVRNRDWNVCAWGSTFCLMTRPVFWCTFLLPCFWFLSCSCRIFSHFSAQERK